MKRGVIVGIVLVLVVVIVASAWALTRAQPPVDQGGVNYVWSSFTVEEGTRVVSTSPTIVTDMNTGNETIIYSDWTTTMTYVNVTVSVFNTAESSRTVNLTAAVYYAPDNRYFKNTDWTGDYGDYDLYEYSVKPGAPRTFVLTIEVPWSLQVTNDMVFVYLDGEKV